MYLTIKSKRFKKNIDFFWSGTRGGYVYIDLSGKSKNPGTLGRQICHGGGLLGSTISAYSEEDFEKVCRSWWRSYLRENPDYENLKFD